MKSVKSVIFYLTPDLRFNGDRKSLTSPIGLTGEAKMTARRAESVDAVCRRWQRRYQRIGFGKRAVTVRRKARRKGRP